MGNRARLKRAGATLVCLLMLLLSLPTRAAAPEAEAEELTLSCAFTFLGSRQERAFALTDGKINTSCKMQAGDELIVTGDRDMGTLILRFYQQDVDFLLTQRDERDRELGTRTLTAAVALTVSLTPGCRKVRIEAPEAGLRISEALVYGPGELPQDVPHPAPPLDRADFLLVSTHPDDEWVFLGGVYPIYGGERGYAGTVVYVTLPTWERAQECINGLWIGGVRTHPFFLGFPDVRQSAPKREKDTFHPEEVTRELVRLYRRIRPLVVVTQDPENGEYGHWQHKLSAVAAFDAVQLAADPAYDPDSARQYGVWTVQKVYQHFAQGVSSLELDVDAPLSSYGGKTALEVANEAFQAHRTQLRTPYRPGNDDETRGDIRRFGLTWSMVGPDTGDDLFEHIPAEALAAYVPPTPTPAPSTATPKDVSEGTEETHPGSVSEGAEPWATPTPTPTPAAEPTAPVAAAAPAATSVPDPAAASSVWDKAETGALWAADRASVLSALLALLIVLPVVLRQVVRNRHGRRRLSPVSEPEEAKPTEEGGTP